MSKKVHRRSMAGPVIAACVIVAAVIAVIVWIILRGIRPVDPAESSADSEPAATTTVTTTTTTANTTTTTTAAPTSSAATTTKKKTTAATTKATASADGRLDAKGLLQYDTTGRYVQAKSYANTADIPWNLLLVNDWNGMPDGYDDRITLKSVGSQKCDERIYDAMQAMFKAGAAYNIGAQSGYRAYSKQDKLYWREVKLYTDKGYDNIRAQEVAGTVVKRPGYSEHNTGLAVDVYGSGNASLNQAFAKTKAYDWLMEHCAEYGFILRFPKGKEDITGVIYEPWHYRYVGVEAATYIMEHGICLEEYLEQTGK